MNETTKEAWTSVNKKMSPEAMAKRRSINKKILTIGCLPIIILFGFVIFATSLDNDENSQSDEIEPVEYSESISIEQLNREIKGIDSGVDFSAYRETVPAIQRELILFATWATIITDGLESDDQQIKTLASKLKSKVISLQMKQFPIMRKEYVKVVGHIMWENDIEVQASSTRNKHINFTGGVLAANKNKQDLQVQVNDVLTMLRFTQSRYRWYEGQDKFTYYTIFKGKDSDFVTFIK